METEFVALVALVADVANVADVLGIVWVSITLDRNIWRNFYLSLSETIKTCAVSLLSNQRGNIFL